MSVISDLLAQIRTAVYGREVRESIASGIEQCYTDVQSGVTTAETAATAATSAASAATNATSAANTAASAANTAATNAERVDISQSKANGIVTITTTDRNNQQTSTTIHDTEIDDSAGVGSTDKVWSADKLVKEFIANVPVIEETLSTEAAIAEITDAAVNLPVKLTVGIDPVQDLHGYEYPWVGGAGKNLISNDMFENGGIAIAGKNNSSDTEIRQKTYFPVTPGTTYSVSCLNDGNIYFFAYFYNGTTMDSRTDETPFTVPANVDGMRIKFGFGENPRPAIDDLIIQLELGSTVTSWSPYSNICPITGWTGCKVTRTGKNFVDVSLADWKLNYRISEDGEETSNSSYKFTQYYYRVNGGGTVSVSFVGNSGYTSRMISMAVYDSNKQFVERVILINTDTPIPSGYNKATATLPNGASYVRFTFPKGLGITNMMLEYAPDATEYEPFGITYNIAFPAGAGTVYDSELTVNKDGSGSLLVRGYYIKIDQNTSNLAFNSDTGQLRKTDLPYSMYNSLYHLCDQYAPYNGSFANLPDKRFMASSYSLAIKDTNYTSLQAWKTHLEEIGGIEFCLRILTSYMPSYSLTPGQVKSLLGYNALWVDAGNIKSVDYGADTKSYIDALFSSILPATGVSF